jgi:hypothetical protein
MGWQDLLVENASRLTIPWLGGRRIYREGRTWRVYGPVPQEHGWYEWKLGGRRAIAEKAVEPDPDYGEDYPKLKGYLIGNRLISWDCPSVSDPDDIVNHTIPVHFVEPGLDRFTPVVIVVDPEDRSIYKHEIFPLGPEDQVRRAFIDKKETVDDIPHVTPAMDLAFRFATRQRQLLIEHRAEIERQRAEERRREEAMRNMGTGLGRRTLAAVDFETAARAALAVGGAELLDVRPGRTGREAVVQYRIEHRRLECVCEKDTMRIIDSGICLTDHRSGEKGDTYFVLESLPAVVMEAIRGHKLVVYRHVDGDDARDDDGWEDDY